ncbi:MAG: hypothetical protein FWE60_03950, partial [Oscillospiraceae bacterium]|nr:hypothetical protein [Oscillospiraceae bacterium]
MNEFRRIDNLNEHILSKRVTQRLTAELLSKTGRDDFFVVFLSVCNKKERARVFHGTGSSLPGAWDDARRNLNAFYKGISFDAAWVKADVVTNYKEIPTIELNEIMVTEQWVNFTRVGISLDADFTNAYIEAEINANKIITYYTEREIYAQEADFSSNRIFLENLNNYRKTYYGLKPLDSVPERITVFTARGFFCGEEDNLVYELYSNSMDYGRRRVDEVTGREVREIIIGASEYLARQIGDDGKFIYGYFPVFDNELKSYNIVRHASSLWSLINLYRMSGDKELIPKLEASIGYMNTFIEYKDENTAYLVERKAGEIKLGANGVAIIMFTEYMDVFKSKKYVDLVRKFANGILQLQNPKTGGYWHILEFPGFTRKEEFRTVYYDGEATFALA